jgi:hypothetical protein
VQWDYTLWIAVGVGGLLILLAILFAIFRRRRAKRLIAQNAIPLAEVRAEQRESSGELKGKLDIYGIVVDGGNTEIPAVSYRFSPSDRGKTLTLEAVMASADVPYHYPAAAKIRFSSGANGTLVVKNNSNATIFIAAQPYYSGQQAALVYGQKLYIVFEDQVSEFEVYYLRTMENVSPGTHAQVDLVNNG